MILTQYLFDVLPFPRFIVPLLGSFLLAFFVFAAYHLPGVPTSLRVLIAILAFLCSMADWVLFALLPSLGLSYGPVEGSWLVTTLIRLLLYLIPVVAFKITVLRKGTIGVENVAVAIAILWVINLIVLPYMYRSMYVEPFDLQVSTVPINMPTISSERPLNIVHLSDIHVERITERERDMLIQVNALQPDMILLTGDYINIDYKSDPEAQAATREVLSQLHAPLGVYAVSGSPSVDVPEVVEKVLPALDNITWLEDESVSLEWQGQLVNLIGMSVNHDYDELTEDLQSVVDTASADAYNILLYHEPNPEIIEAALQEGIDLFLAGHTHGGQFRFPIIGAPMALHPHYFRENDRGKYQIGPMTLYVSSGIGMEGLYLPRFRFNVPPEIVNLQLGALE
jgi:hypothetical protein